MNFSLGGVFSFFAVSYKYIIYIVYHLLTIRYQRVLTGLPIVKLTSSIFTAKRSQFSSVQKLCSFSAIVVFGKRAQQKRCYYNVILFLDNNLDQKMLISEFPYLYDTEFQFDFYLDRVPINEFNLPLLAESYICRT